MKSSTADFAIVGGDFNIDPRMTNETTYQTLTADLKNAMHEFFYYIEVQQSFLPVFSVPTCKLLSA